MVALETCCNYIMEVKFIAINGFTLLYRIINDNKSF